MAGMLKMEKMSPFTMEDTRPLVRLESRLRESTGSRFQDANDCSSVSSDGSSVSHNDKSSTENPVQWSKSNSPKDAVEGRTQTMVDCNATLKPSAMEVQASTQVQASSPSLSQQLAKPRLDVRLVCPDCRDPRPNIIEDFSAGDLLCGDCGLVLRDRVIDTRSEWRTFSNSDDVRRPDPSRVGSAGDDLLGGFHVDSTVISQWGGKGGNVRELGRVHGRVTSQKAEKQLFHAFREIQAMCERIGLQRVTSDSAKQLYKKVEDGKLLRGRASEAIMAACIYIGCREHGVTRTFKEICELARVSKKEIGRIYKVLAPLLDAPAQQISLESYVVRFSSALGLPQDVRRAAPIVIKRVINLGTLAGKSPVSIAAACIYFVNNLAKDPISAKGVATVAGCTEATLRNAYRYLYEARYELGKDLKMPRDVSSLPP